MGAFYLRLRRGDASGGCLHGTNGSCRFQPLVLAGTAPFTSKSWRCRRRRSPRGTASWRSTSAICSCVALRCWHLALRLLWPCACFGLHVLGPTPALALHLLWPCACFVPAALRSCACSAPTLPRPRGAVHACSTAARLIPMPGCWRPHPACLQVRPGPLGAVQGQHEAPGQALLPQPGLPAHPHVSLLGQQGMSLWVLPRRAVVSVRSWTLLS